MLFGTNVWKVSTQWQWGSCIGRLTIMSLCYRCFFQENLAYNKPTDQSSTDAGGNSNRAVDGKIITNYHSGSCTHTQTENSPWWRVDLGRVELVSEVYVVNRGDCCGARLSSFEIRVGRSNFGFHFS